MLPYYQNGFVKLPVVTAIALGFMLGAYLGARLVPAIPVAGLRFGFGAMMLFLGFQFVFSPGDGKSAVALPAGVATAITALLGWASRRFYRASPEQRESESARDDYHI